MTLPRHRGAAAAHQEIQIAANVRLIDMLYVKARVTARRRCRRRLPGGAPAGKLFIGDVQVQTAGLQVEPIL